MFGSVPKTLWQRKISADSENRIALVARIGILENDSRRVLIDMGCGQKYDEKHRTIYQLRHSSSKRLDQLIMSVTDVIITHLHFDHVGGVSYREKDGMLKLSYPSARHIIQSENWRVAQNPGPRERATYLTENIEPLKSAKLELVEDGAEVVPGVRVYRSDGHTRGLQWVKIGEGERAVVFPSELMPTAHHVSVPWVMGYDLAAEVTMNDKAGLAEAAVCDTNLIVFGHDADTAAGRLGVDERGRYYVRERVELPKFDTSSG